MLKIVATPCVGASALAHLASDREIGSDLDGAIIGEVVTEAFANATASNVDPTAAGFMVVVKVDHVADAPAADDTPVVETAHAVEPVEAEALAEAIAGTEAAEAGGGNKPTVEGGIGDGWTSDPNAVDEAAKTV